MGETVDKLGGLDVLVNSAGILMSGSVEKLDIADYDKVMNINTRAAFILTQAVIPALLLSKGNIVHISSVTGLRAFPGVVSYNMSKAALDMLTRTAALELADRGVRVNTVNPGVIVTPCHKNSGMSEEDYARFLEHSKTTHAMGRPGLCKRWRTRWPSLQGRGPPSSLDKPLPSMGAGALCVQDRDKEENPSRCFFYEKRKIK